MPTAWQSFPLSIDPVALMVGGLPVTWYAIFYIAGVFVAAVYFVWLARRAGLLADADATVEVIVSVLWGVLIGARLGYIAFYGGPDFISEPWRIILPYDFDQDRWVGIRGMSFHGGLIGGAVGLFMFTRERRRGFLPFSDSLVQAVPLAIIFGRIGNFLNQEILGRSTSLPWGMYFPGSGSLLHPVVLYEAATEGVILFLVLAALKPLQMAPGRMTVVFLFLYAGIRYLMEYFRAVPHTLVFGIVTTGQALSVALALSGAVILLATRKRVVY
ncbi:MAG: prolipoprotein diacylglyceryl transferase [Candidatus Moraniibacteriota bacterium]